MIEIYVNGGVNNAREMKRLLDIHVKNILFANCTLPDADNRRFYPKKSSIRSRILRAIRKTRSSNIDQVLLKAKIEEWKREDSSRKIYFREKIDPSCPSQNAEDSEVERLKFLVIIKNRNTFFKS